MNAMKATCHAFDTRSLLKGNHEYQQIGYDNPGANRQTAPMNSFGSRLRALRETRNWSQEQLGFELGVTKATVSKWETDRARPGLDTLLKIKTLFADQSVSLDFLGGDTSIRTSEQNGTYAADPRLAQSPDELQLLLLFRNLSKQRRLGLLKLLGG